MTPEALKAAMDRLNIKTAKALADALHVRSDTVGRWLKGETSVPHMARLALAALAYNLPPME